MDEVEHHLTEARGSRDAGRYDEAVRSCRRAVELARERGQHENLGHALLLTAVCRLRQGQLAHEMPLLDEAQMAARLSGNAQLESDVLAVKGLVHRQEGRLLLASRCYRHALALRPGHIGLLNNLATIEALLGRDEQALPRFETMRDAGPEFAATGWLNMARSLERLGRPDQALEALQQAEALLAPEDPRQFWAHHIRASLVRGEQGLLLAQSAMPLALTAAERRAGRILVARLFRETGAPEEGLAELEGLGGEALDERAACAAAAGQFQLAYALQLQSTQRVMATLDRERDEVMQQMDDADRHVEREILDALERAETARRTRTRFLASVNHELRTPVMALVGASELLLASQLSPDQEQLTRMIGDAAALTRDLLGGLLDLRQLENEGVLLRSAPFDPTEAVSEVCRLLKPRVRDGVQLTVDSQGVPTRVIGDGTRFRQVVLNLVGNAAKFTEQGHIRVVMRWRDELWVEVQDTGPGLDSVQLLEPYAKAGAGAGSGLGLAICRGLVEAWGSELSVRSSSSGTVFSFSAPFPTVAVPGDARPARVLVVDDQAVNRLVMDRQLRRLGHSPMLATDGTEALAKSAEADIVLLDIHMPGPNGWETARQLRAQGFGGSIIALTADLQTETRTRCLEAGMNALLAKPCSADELHAALQQWMR